MKKSYPLVASISFVSILLFSCAGSPRTLVPGDSMAAAKASMQIASVPETAPKRPEKPEIPPKPQEIMGLGMVNEQKMADFLLEANPEVDKNFALEFARFYIVEAQAEGINHDIAFSQMCLETGFLKFGGLVTPDMNNFCGLGAIGPEQRGEIFPDTQTGVRAHIQHLKAYASEEPLNQDLVDPRFRWVRRGRSPKIEGLTGTWASDRQYAPKIEAILERLYEYSFGENS
ncbi:glucosaminidase domain-containing protein [Leadbettera azotonutricia]|uniref:Cell wall hydrolase/autolysin n=1 Tax=Leadbettera azotonutricia (strain ATCC BAA-888 / DSM 13862 / ZAS-9) TaxID=545695 RepID=F5Y789_LEAAZ|nr:glucosaminidase domain-containing protein [Leadbettera azotonutricia]AEF80772.1 cell wall hydrolase/autolysin [Leadbettera azotonutricia ZAS-9]